MPMTAEELDRWLAAEPDEIDRQEAVLSDAFAQNAGLSELLLPALASGVDAKIANARRLLCLFDETALLTIARGFSVDNPTARYEILGVLWAFLIGVSPRDREGLLSDVAPHLKVGLNDARRPDHAYAVPEHVEEKHDWRICDETYLFLNRLRSADFDDSYYEKLEEARQDGEIGQFARRLDNLFGSPAVVARKAAGGPTPLTELTIVTSFPDIVESKQQERDRVAAGQWSPTLKDFRAVAAVDTPSGAIFEASSFLSLLSAIIYTNPAAPNTSPLRPTQSLKRVNIITHGNPGLIGMSGTATPTGAVYFAPAAATPLDGHIDVAAVQAANDPTLLLPGKQPLVATLRDRLAPKAEIFLIACHSGMAQSVPLMLDLKSFFQATIQAYADPIYYCPSYDAAQVLDRTITGIGSCSGAKPGFRHLTPQRTF